MNCPPKKWRLNQKKLILSPLWQPEVWNEDLVSEGFKGRVRSLPPLVSCGYWCSSACSLASLQSLCLPFYASFLSSLFSLLNLPWPFSYKDTCHWIGAHLDNPGWPQIKVLHYIRTEPSSQWGSDHRVQGLGHGLTFWGHLSTCCTKWKVKDWSLHLLILHPGQPLILVNLGAELEEKWWPSMKMIR